MPTNTSGGTTTSFFNTPQATDNCYTADEDCVYYFDVMSDDLGGNAKVLWSIDDNDLYGTTTTSADGTTTTTTNVDSLIDLTVKDAAGCVEKSTLGASISIVDGKVKYDARGLDWLAEGQTATDYFTYAIRLSNGTLSWATVAITLTGSNDAPTIVSATAVGDVTEKAEPAEGGTLSDTGTITFADVDLPTPTAQLSPPAWWTKTENPSQVRWAPLRSELSIRPRTTSAGPTASTTAPSISWRRARRESRSTRSPSTMGTRVAT